jgi:hypothetical protein
MSDEQKNETKTGNDNNGDSPEDTGAPQTEKGDSRLKFKISEATGFILDHDRLNEGRF